MEEFDAMNDVLVDLSAKYAGTSKDGNTNAMGSNPYAKSETDRMETSMSSNEHPNVMTLDVGGRKFRTSRITLLESGLFRHQLSDNFTWKPEADGSYFLDADPELFEHLLRFMRRPNVFPLFYSAAHGFDYDLYNRLENEAEYFQIDALRIWINLKKYLRAVVLQTYQAQVRNLKEVAPERTLINETEDRHMIPRTKKVYICPRGIVVHRGDPDRCGRACQRAQGDDDDEFEEVSYIEVVSVKKEVEFVSSICNVE